jgi:hypothetical protein
MGIFLKVCTMVQVALDSPLTTYITIHVLGTGKPWLFAPKVVIPSQTAPTNPTVRE